MDSAITPRNLKAAAPDTGVAGGAAHMDEKDQIKVRFAYKFAAFCASVVTLSWFFEGTRQCKDALSISGIAYLVGGTVLTLLLLGLQGFFTYCEERSKGRRTRNIALFDKWYLFLTSKQKGDCTNRG